MRCPPRRSPGRVIVRDELQNQVIACDAVALLFSSRRNTGFQPLFWLIWQRPPRSQGSGGRPENGWVMRQKGSWMISRRLLSKRNGFAIGRVKVMEEKMASRKAPVYCNCTKVWQKKTRYCGKPSAVSLGVPIPYVVNSAMGEGLGRWRLQMTRFDPQRVRLKPYGKEQAAVDCRKLKP